MDLGFNIGFELEIDDSLEQAIDLILEQIEHNASRRTLQSMMKQLIQNSSTFKIKTILTEATKLLYKESHYFELKQLQDIDFDAPCWVQSLEPSSKQLMALALELCETTENLILNEGVKLSDFSGGSRGIGYFWNKFKSTEPDKLAGLFAKKGNTATYNAIYNDEWTTKSSKATATVLALAEDLKKAYEQLKQLTLELEYKRILKRTLPQTYLVLEVLKNLKGIYQQHHSVDIYTVKTIIADLLEQEGAVPVIYETMAFKFQHYFIDEFQDTSNLQFKNLYPLIKESLDTGYYSLLVGDPKQSIYRWRGGEVDNFIQLLNRISTPKTKGLLPFVEPQTLDYNYRSVATVIQFNNTFFEHSSQYLKGIYEKAYADVAQKTPQTANEDGYVYLKSFLIEKTKSKITGGDEEEDLASEGDYLSLLEADLILQLEEIRTRGYSWGDVAILCRSNQQIVSITEVLERHQVPFVSERGLVFERSPELDFLVQWVRLWIHPNDGISKLFILQYLIRHTIVTTPLAHYLAQESWSLDQCLKEHGIVVSWSLLKQVTLSEYFEHLMALFFEPYGIKSIFFSFFLSEVKAFERTHTPHDYYRFLSHWDLKLKKKDLKLQGERHYDAITLQTIHKSKGLQYPIVILPFTDSKLQDPSTDLYWYPFVLEDKTYTLPITQKELQHLAHLEPYAQELLSQELEKSDFDTINMLYVAHTRAEQELYIYVYETKSERPSVSSVYKSFVEQQTGNFESPFCYTLGQPSFPKGEKRMQTQDASLILEPDYSFSDWHKKIPISNQVTSVYKIEQQYNEQQGFGEQLHLFLAQIETLKDVAPVEAEIIRLYGYSKEVAQSYQTALQQILNHSSLKSYFEGTYTSYNNPSFLDQEGNIHRFDRLCISEQEAVVLDFRTGTYLEEHQEHLKKYLNVVKDELSLPVKGILVYTQTMNLVFL